MPEVPQKDVPENAAAPAEAPTPYGYEHAMRDVHILYDGRLAPEAREEAHERLARYISSPDHVDVSFDVRAEPPVGELPETGEVLRRGHRIFSSSGGSGVRYVTIETDGEVLGHGQRSTFEASLRQALADYTRRQGGEEPAEPAPRAALGGFCSSELDRQILNSGRLEAYQEGDEVVVELSRFGEKGGPGSGKKFVYKGRGTTFSEAAEAAVVQPDIFPASQPS